MKISKLDFADTFLHVGSLVVCSVMYIDKRISRWLQVKKEDDALHSTKRSFLILGIAKDLTVFGTVRHYETDKGILTLVTSENSCVIIKTT